MKFKKFSDSIFVRIFFAVLFVAFSLLFSFSSHPSVLTAVNTIKTQIGGNSGVTEFNPSGESRAVTYGVPIYDPPVTITVLDIGQGDAHLIRVGKEYSLMDTGDVEHRAQLISLLRKIGVKKLKRVLISHPHSDHLGGFYEVAGNISVESLYDNGEEYNTSVYKTFRKIVERQKINYNPVRAGDTIDFGDGATFIVYAPKDEYITTKGGKPDINNNSIVGKFEFGKFSMLFTGDAERTEENVLIKEQNTKLFSRILKVAHHGSNTSSQKDFLRSVRPEVAVISVGFHNDYQHPSNEVLKRLQNENITVFRTDEDGSITIDTDGKSWYIKAER